MGAANSSHPNLGTRLASGATWKLAAAGSSVALGVGSQFALGWLLSEGDFGVYALAISVASVVSAARDGGVRLVLTRLTPAEFRRQANSGLAISGLTAMLVASVLMVVAHPISEFYGEPDVELLIRIIAVALPLDFVDPIAFAGLHVAMRFRTVSILEFGATVLRYSLMVTFAFLGLGPLSFVLPIPIVNVAQSAVAWIALRRTGLTPSKGFAAWRDVLRLSPWAVFGAWATFLYLSVDNLILGRVISTAAVGFYYFGYQIVIKLTTLFTTLRDVIIPGFVALADDDERQQQLIDTAGLIAGGIAGPAFVLMAILSQPVVSLVWQGRWDSSVGSIRVLALAMPAFVFLSLCEMILQARGRFGMWTGVVVMRGLAVALAAFVGASLTRGDDPTTAALSVSVAIAGGSLLLAFFSVRAVRASFRSVIRRFLAPYGFALGVALVILIGQNTMTQPAPISLVAGAIGFLLAMNVGHRWVITGTAEALSSVLGRLRVGRALGAFLGVGARDVG